MDSEVVVVGGGAIGVSAAYELARRGVAVTLLERDRLASGCSSGNAGLVCPSHSSPLATPAALREGVRALLRSDAALSLRPHVGTLGWLARFAVACRNAGVERATDAIRALSTASLELHAELAPLGTGFERRGTLSVYETEGRFAAGRREAERSGLASQVLSASDARELEPAIRGTVAGAVFFPDEAHVDPLRFVEAVGAAAAEAGAELRTGIAVRSLERRDGRIALETDGGRIVARTVVLAAGAWTGRLARGLGVRVPLTGGKGYHVDVEPAPGDPQVPILLQEARLAATPLPDRLRIAGLLEVAGIDAGLRDGRVEALRRAAARVFGADERPALDVWAGLRPCAPDGLPVLGRVAACPELVIATGHAMKGVSLAPVTGRLVAELVARDQPSHDLAPFSPDRFH